MNIYTKLQKKIHYYYCLPAGFGCREEEDVRNTIPGARWMWKTSVGGVKVMTDICGRIYNPNDGTPSLTFKFDDGFIMHRAVIGKSNINFNRGTDVCVATTETTDYFDLHMEHIECLRYYSLIERGNLVFASQTAFVGLHMVEFFLEKLPEYTEEELVDIVAYGLAYGGKDTGIKETNTKGDIVMDTLSVLLPSKLIKCMTKHKEFTLNLFESFIESIYGDTKPKEKDNPFESEDGWDV